MMRGARCGRKSHTSVTNEKSRRHASGISHIECAHEKRPLLASLATAQFGTIQIDWSGETSDEVLVQTLLDAVDVEQPEQQQEDGSMKTPGVKGFRRGPASSDGASPTVRTVRPLAVKYRLVRCTCTANGARGVIIGGMADTLRRWIRGNAGQLGASMARLRAHYSVLES